MKRLITAIAIVAATAAGSWFASGSTTIVQAAGQTPAGLITVTPDRVLNTRTTTKVPAEGSVTVNTKISGAAAVVANITVVDQEGGGGYITAWTGGPRPDTSIINSDGQTIANSSIIPVNSDGTFQLYTFRSAHLLVDVMGYFPGSVAVTANSGLTAQITGYAPASSITLVSGTASNGTTSTKSFRVDVKCPDGTVQPDNMFSVASGATKGWSVLCSGAFTSGATIQAVVDL